MSTDALRAHYLESLSRLQRGWVHETRSHLGNVSLQLDLMSELLDRAGLEAAGRDRLGAPIGRARAGVTRLERCLDLYLGAAMARRDQGPGLDLASTLAELGELLEPAARERQVAWSAAGAPPVAVPRVAREALGVAAVGLLLDSPAGSSLALRCEHSGDRVAVRFSAAPSAAGEPAWLPAVRDALSACGGSARLAGDRGALELSFPAAHEDR